MFTEAGAWQDEVAKMEKLVRLGLAREEASTQNENGGTVKHFKLPENLFVMILPAVDKSFSLDYRLRDLGLRKGSYIEKNGIEIMFDDSEVYCNIMPAMCAASIARVLR
jgi:hypothetical protein